MEKMRLEKPGKDTFERQFAKREMIETAGGTAEVVDIIPAHQKDDVPTLFAPAWSCTLPLYEPALRTLSEQGRRVISLNHPRTGGDIRLTDEQKKLVEKYPIAEIRKALTLVDILNEKNTDSVDVIAHSEGSLNSALAALLYPEKFPNIVMFGPPGLIGKDTPQRLLQGFAAQGGDKPSLREITVSDADKAAAAAEGRVAIEYPEITAKPENEKIINDALPKEFAKYVLKNPVRALQEGWGMAHVDADGLLEALHERGVDVIIMSAVDDPVFDTKKMAERMKKGVVRGFLSMRGGHGQINDTPEYHMVIAEQMLTALKAKKLKDLQADTSAE